MEAAPGFEPGMEDLQSSALATWLCRHETTWIRSNRTDDGIPGCRVCQGWSGDFPFALSPRHFLLVILAPILLRPFSGSIIELLQEIKDLTEQELVGAIQVSGQALEALGH